jgi:DNA-binding MarR family transcriptional regulator
MSLIRNSGEKLAPAPNGEVDYGLLPSLVGYRVRKAYSYLFQTFTLMLRDVGLAPGQYSVLLLIALNPGLSQMALAEATGLDGSTIVPITNRFVKLGWIRRVRRKDDRRFYELRIAQAGQAVLDEARPIIEAHERNLVAGLSEAECRTLIELLSRITENRSVRTLLAKGKAGEGAAAQPQRRARRTGRQRHGS